mmetsp:Transcript_10131/g.21908  ORF Transcript_10131/g.21908 Transcript_10131/m.21908 type:complete len:749 (+) Transcript_10131:162-2408(+)
MVIEILSFSPGGDVEAKPAKDKKAAKESWWSWGGSKKAADPPPPSSSWWSWEAKKVPDPPPPSSQWSWGGKSSEKDAAKPSKKTFKASSAAATPAKSAKVSKSSSKAKSSKASSKSGNNCNDGPPEKGLKSKFTKRTILILLAVFALLALVGGLAAGLANRNNADIQASNAVALDQPSGGSGPSWDKCNADWGGDGHEDWWTNDGWGTANDGGWANDGWGGDGHAVANSEWQRSAEPGPFRVRRRLEAEAEAEQEERHYSSWGSSKWGSQSSSWSSDGWGNSGWGSGGYQNNNNGWGGDGHNPRGHPYLVSIGGGHHSHHCAGTLISASVVLTAAHCFTQEKTGAFHPLQWADFRRYNLSHKEHVVRVYLSDKEGVHVIRHPQWDPKTLANDFALIVLSQEEASRIKVKGPITPIELNGRQDVPGDSDGHLQVVGWGFTSPNPHVTPNTPNLAKLDYVPNRYCMAGHGHKFKWPQGRIEENMMCAHAGHRHHASCNLDSGGPIIKDTPSGPVQVGVSSFVAKISPHHCASEGYPTVFARVSSAIGWIEHTACARRQELCHEQPPPSSGWQAPPTSGWQAPPSTIQGSHNEWHAPPTEPPKQDEWTPPAEPPKKDEWTPPPAQPSKPVVTSNGKSSKGASKGSKGSDWVSGSKGSKGGSKGSKGSGWGSGSKGSKGGSDSSKGSKSNYRACYDLWGKSNKGGYDGKGGKSNKGYSDSAWSGDAWSGDAWSDDAWSDGGGGSGKSGKSRT